MKRLIIKKNGGGENLCNIPESEKYNNLYGINATFNNVYEIGDTHYFLSCIYPNCAPVTRSNFNRLSEDYMKKLGFELLEFKTGSDYVSEMEGPVESPIIKYLLVRRDAPDALLKELNELAWVMAENNGIYDVKDYTNSEENSWEKLHSFTMV